MVVISDSLRGRDKPRRLNNRFAALANGSEWNLKLLGAADVAGSEHCQTGEEAHEAECS